MDEQQSKEPWPAARPGIACLCNDSKSAQHSPSALQLKNTGQMLIPPHSASESRRREMNIFQTTESQRHERQLEVSE